MFDHKRQDVENKIRAFCKEESIPFQDCKWTPIPISGEWGISTSFFQIAAQESQGKKDVNVPQRAQELAEQVRDRLGKQAGIRRIEAIKGYLNLYFSISECALRLVNAVLEQGVRFGATPPLGQRIMVEYSHPNTHKAFHVGHLRSAILGDSLSRILEFAGYDVVRTNYPGDVGLHVIRWLWNYLKHHQGEQPDKDITKWMGDIYVEAVRRLEAQPELEAEVRALYARWDHRDPEVVSLWERTRQWSLDGFNQMYDALDIQFDKYYFNSEEEQPGKEMVTELIQRGIAIDERTEGGAVFVKIDELLGLPKEHFRTAVILRSDGTALYSTEDLALVLHKFQDYPDLVSSIYVVDVRQSLHFTQVFKILEIAGYEQAKKCIHVPYELVTLPGNVVLSSREGTVVLLEDLIREAISRAKTETHRKNPDLTGEQLEHVAQAIGLGALKYPLLARENVKVVTFDWESALDFNGQAAPYIQYAHVRCNSILRKAQATPTPLEAAAFDYSMEPTEVELIDWLSRFPSEVQRSAAEYKPLVIATMAYEMARTFTTFYDQCPVIQAEPQVRTARLALVAATKQTLANALRLLGITAPEVM